MDEEVVKAVKAGLAWLYETEQPAGAALSHHGTDLTAGIRRLAFVPQGYARLPVVVITVKDQRWTRHSPYQLSELENPLAEGELGELADLIRELGRPVAKTWNGKYESGSVGLADPAHPTLLATVDRYRQGCQSSGPYGDGGKTHDTGSVFCRCRWLYELSQRIVRPVV